MQTPRASLASVLTLMISFAAMSAPSYGQNGILGRAGRALDNTGRNIRNRVETEVARGQINAQERDVVRRVIKRIEWDKPLIGSVLQVEARGGGVILLRGSVATEQTRRHAVSLVSNTIGVSSVVDELAVMKGVKIIESQPAQIIDLTPPEAADPAPGTTVIRKP